jgi:hypothetical protein
VPLVFVVVTAIQFGVSGDACAATPSTTYDHAIPTT